MLSYFPLQCNQIFSKKEAVHPKLKFGETNAIFCEFLSRDAKVSDIHKNFHFYKSLVHVGKKLETKLQLALVYDF